MRWFAGSRGFALGWRLALVALAGIILWLVVTLPPSSPATGQRAMAPANDAADVAPPVGGSAKKSGYLAISTHPVFFPDRKPWEPPPPPEQEPVVPEPPSLASFQAVGVIVSGATRYALVKPTSDETVTILAQGQEFEGWTLQDISQERLHFVAGKTEYDMIFPLHSERGQ